MISPIVFRLPGRFRFRRWAAVVLDDFQSPRAVGVGPTPERAYLACVSDYVNQSNDDDD